MRTFAWLMLLGLVGGCGGAAAGGAKPAELSAAKESAPQGAKVFAQSCAGCHGNEGQGLSGAPRVMGDGALPLKGAHGEIGPLQTAEDLFQYLKGAMPLPKSKVGSLSDEEYWAVTAYLLKASGRSLPEEGLTADNASSVEMNAAPASGAKR